MEGGTSETHQALLVLGLHALRYLAHGAGGCGSAAEADRNSPTTSPSGDGGVTLRTPALRLLNKREAGIECREVFWALRGGDYLVQDMMEMRRQLSQSWRMAEKRVCYKVGEERCGKQCQAHGQRRGTVGLVSLAGVIAKQMSSCWLS